jgi:hypothetical protein
MEYEGNRWLAGQASNRVSDEAADIAYTEDVYSVIKDWTLSVEVCDILERRKRFYILYFGDTDGVSRGVNGMEA